MSNVPLLPGVSAHTAATSRLNMHYLAYGKATNPVVVLVHGNLSTGRFFEHLLPDLNQNFYYLLPDMRCFGRTEAKTIDPQRGLEDWADDLLALFAHLKLTAPVHLLGWSTGAAAITALALKAPTQVASLSLVAPVPPFGFGGCKLDGKPCFTDWSGSGGGIANQEFVDRLRAQDQGAQSIFSPRNVLAASYWSPQYKMDEARLTLLVEEVLLSVIGDNGYPGNATDSANWPGVAPGDQGILNALSGKHCNWSSITTLANKPPILWTHGNKDIVVADQAMVDLGHLGQLGFVPNWPGADIFPAQPMVQQINKVLYDYAQTGGQVVTQWFAQSGHAPFIDAQAEWCACFNRFLSDNC